MATSPPPAPPAPPPFGVGDQVRYDGASEDPPLMTVESVDGDGLLGLLGVDFDNLPCHFTGVDPAMVRVVIKAT